MTTIYTLYTDEVKAMLYFLNNEIGHNQNIIRVKQSYNSISSDINYMIKILPFSLFAQRTTPFQNREFNLYLDNFLIHDTTHFNLYDADVLNYKTLESIDSINYPRKQKKNYLVKKIRRENFVRINKNDFYLTLDPLFNFAGGIDLKDSLY